MDLCLSGDGCGDVAVESSTFPGVYRFCKWHQERLDSIREWLEAGAWERNVRNKESSIITICETVGCSNRPVYGSDHCDECQGGDY